jgi:hypothetical protein
MMPPFSTSADRGVANDTSAQKGLESRWPSNEGSV